MCGSIRTGLDPETWVAGAAGTRKTGHPEYRTTRPVQLRSLCEVLTFNPPVCPVA